MVDDWTLRRELAQLRNHVNVFRNSLGAKDIDDVGRIGKEIVAKILLYEAQIAVMEKQIAALQAAVKALQP
jgi:hypothetical protein